MSKIWDDDISNDWLSLYDLIDKWARHPDMPLRKHKIFKRLKLDVEAISDVIDETRHSIGSSTPHWAFTTPSVFKKSAALVKAIWNCQPFFAINYTDQVSYRAQAAVNSRLAWDIGLEFLYRCELQSSHNGDYLAINTKPRYTSSHYMLEMCEHLSYDDRISHQSAALILESLVYLKNPDLRKIRDSIVGLTCEEFLL